MDNTDAHKAKYKEERLYMSTNQNLMQHMRELIDCIKAADVAYYRDDNPTMTDREYDLLVDELKELEATTGMILSGSPTQTVSGEILKELTPVRHTKPMLSADKTKSVDEMLQFANGRPVVLSWKLDGLTLVLRYEGGEFKQAITRGREGIIGEDVTHTVRTFMNVPMCIPCTDKFEVRGEGVISWAHFEKINLSLSEPYSHPRNLAAGSVRMLDARESGKRYLEFFAFDLISDSIEEQRKTAQLQFLAENGFDVVPYVYTDTHDADELRELIANFKPAEYGYPVDGVIMEYDNLVYGRSLGATGHHENRLMALKWEDELYETECTGLDVAVTRTGMVSLTATFKPVEIDGTMVSRAYVHNFTIYKNLALGIGDKLMVYKANKIIPQIAENRTKSGELDYPHTCPCCGSRLTFHTLPGGSKQLFCENPSCAAKLVQKFDHFCEKTRMNIEGLSATTLEKFIGHGWIKNFGDLYFHGSVDITDPCYNRDVWCRMTDVKIRNGVYTCIAWHHKDKGTFDNGEPYCYDVIGIIGIYLDGVIPCQKDMKEIGSIGVDAGLAGFFHNKPDYTDDEWAAFCDRVRHGDAWLIKEGFYSSSGYGDGCYGVYAYEQGGEITAIEIRFL